MLGGGGEDQEHHLHPLFNQCLAPHLHGYAIHISATHQYPTGAADPLQAADTLHTWITSVPECLNNRECRGDTDLLSVDGNFYFASLDTHSWASFGDFCGSLYGLFELLLNPQNGVIEIERGRHSSTKGQK